MHNKAQHAINKKKKKKKKKKKANFLFFKKAYILATLIQNINFTFH